MKKIFLLMTLLLSAATGFAQSGTCGANLTWTLENGTLTISGTGAMANYNWGSAPWSSNSSSIKTVIIEGGVTSIGDYAFSSCGSLASVTIGNNVESIGNSAFFSCGSLASVTNLNLTPQSISSKDNVFDVSLRFVILSVPAGSVETYQASYDWNRFGAIVATDFVPEENGSCGDLTWTLSNATLTISGAGEMTDWIYSTDSPWYLWRSFIEEVIIEDGVTNIGNHAFSYCSSLASVTIGNSVTSIGNSAFSSCHSLVSITIPNGVTELRDRAFQSCSGLTSITISESVTSIGYSAFSYCSSLASVTIGNSVESIGDSAFSYCSSLASVTIGNSVESIGDYAFSNCSSLASVTIGNSVESIGDSAFSYCSSLASVTIGNSVESIGDSAFSYCSSLASVTIGNSVESIGNYTFSYCSSLASVTIGNSVTSIGNYAFSSCSSLASVTIGNSVESIGYSAFFSCGSLASVTNLNLTPQSISSDVFDNLTLSNATLYVPAGSVETYAAALVWKDFKAIETYVSSAIDAPSAANAVRVYSDPATGSLRIEGLTAPAQVTVINADGQTVRRQTVAGDGNIPTGYLPQGVYLVHVNGQTIKIIK